MNVTLENMEKTSKTPTAWPPLIVTRPPPSMVVSALMVLVLVRVIVTGWVVRINGVRDISARYQTLPGAADGP